MTNKEKNLLQKQIVDQITTPYGRLLLAPRSGKTCLAIKIIKKFKPKSILWVTPSAYLANVGVRDEFIKWKAKRALRRLHTITYSSLHNVTGHYDLIIFDEEQHMTSNNTANLLDKTLTFDNIISMTGTETKNRDKQEIYKSLGLEILIDLSINSAVDIGLLSDYEVNVIKVPYDESKLLEYSKLEKAIKSYKCSNITLEGNELTLKGKLSGKLYIEPRENKFNSSDKVFTLHTGNSLPIGYFVIREDGSFGGKFTVMKNNLFIKDNEVYKEVPQGLYIARKKALSNSLLKTQVSHFIVKRLLSDTRNIVFCSSIKQANNFGEDFAYHSKSSAIPLNNFQEFKSNMLTLVNTGGTGFTYKKVDNLLQIQCGSDSNGTETQKFCRALLAQKNHKPILWTILVEKTQDEKWVKQSLANFDESKINYINFKDEYQSKFEEFLRGE